MIHTDPPPLLLDMKTEQLLVGSHIGHPPLPPAGRMTVLVLEVIHTHQYSALASLCSGMNSQEPVESHILLP